MYTQPGTLINVKSRKKEMTFVDNFVPHIPPCEISKYAIGKYVVQLVISFGVSQGNTSWFQREQKTATLLNIFVLHKF